VAVAAPFDTPKWRGRRQRINARNTISLGVGLETDYI
jgi:hypothetical protein